MKPLLVKNAHVLGHADNQDVLVVDGRYQQIEPSIDPNAFPEADVIDANGDLLSPTFVNTHMHFDKAYTSIHGRESSVETLEDSIRIMHDRKANYTVEDVKERSVRAIRECVAFGTTKIRTNVDIDNFVGLTGLEGVLEAKEATKDICDLQVVAFPQEGIFSNQGTYEMMEEALKMGADIVGGMPAAEWIEADAKKHVDYVIALAQKYDMLIDMHMDQSKDMFDRSMEYTAYRSIQEGLQGKVTGGHCTSITYQNQSHALKVIELLKLADFNVCTNSQVLAIMGIDPEPRTRGVTRIREMVAHGVNVATAQDTICDGFHLYGTGDPLDYGLICAYTAQYNTPGTARIVWDMLTKNSARIFAPDEDYGVKVGNPADFNIIAASSPHEALRLRASRRYVVKGGRVIAGFERKAFWL